MAYGKSLPCRFPPCPCEKCRERRMDDDCSNVLKTSMENSTSPSHDDVSKSLSQNDVGTSLVATKDTFGGLLKFKPSSIYYVLFDVVGTITFIIMMAITFWLMVSYYLWQFVVKIYGSGRKIKAFTLICLSILLFCIINDVRSSYKLKNLKREKSSLFEGSPPNQNTLNSHQGSDLKECHPELHKFNCSSRQESTESTNHNSSRQSGHLVDEQVRCPQIVGADTSNNVGIFRKLYSFFAKPINRTKKRPRECGGAEATKLCTKCGKMRGRYSFLNIKDNPERRSNYEDSKKKASDSLCAVCAKTYNKSFSQSKSVDAADEGRRILEKFKLFGMASEMKSPPTIIVLLKDYLTNYFWGPSGTLTVAQTD